MLAALDRRAANLRTESIPTLTTGLARRHGTIVIEDLDLDAMARGMGRRGFRRGVYQTGLGAVRPTMAYRSASEGGRLLVADRWFASSKTHHGCGGYLADLPLGAQEWMCSACGELVDRNANAARNLRDNIQQLQEWLSKQGLGPHGHSHQRVDNRRQTDLERLSRLRGTPWTSPSSRS